MTATGFSNTVLEADYVIVGGGTTGLVIASRLSEDPNASIIVLEAGKGLSQDPRVQIPALWTSLMGSDADWNFQTVPQGNPSNRCIRTPQGKLLGGSSGINAQAFVAPMKATIDAWEKLGASGWIWKELLPYWKRAYSLNVPDEGRQKHIGIDNWLDLGYHGSYPPVHSRAWTDDFRTTGNGITTDPFSGQSMGEYSAMATVDSETKTRSYAATAYGLPVMQHWAVQIETEAVAQKIRFEHHGLDGNVTATATGVDVVIAGQFVTVNAKLEVIVSAGALNTPKLLELSGIGDEVLLRQFDIPVIVHNSNVGENLQDHLMSGLNPLVRQEPEAVQNAMQLYAQDKTGPLTSGGMQSAAFMPLRGNSEEGHDIQAILCQRDAPVSTQMSFQAQVNLHESGRTFIGQDLLPGNFLSLGVAQTFPFSRGRVHLSSADPSEPPTVDPSALLKPNGRRNYPDAFLSDLDGAKKYLKATATSAYHPCGTTAMLPRENGGVVDEQLRVYGTSNLRVYDASIFPVITTTNPVSTVYAGAERAADLIKRGNG
ncbi:glucose-methanol-choline oxidoreductase [Aspergillus insuetus]